MTRRRTRTRGSRFPYCIDRLDHLGRWSETARRHTLDQAEEYVVAQLLHHAGRYRIRHGPTTLADSGHFEPTDIDRMIECKGCA